MFEANDYLRNTGLSLLTKKEVMLKNEYIFSTIKAFFTYMLTVLFWI